MKKKVLVTGAGGFIGARFIKAFQSEFEIIPVSLTKNLPENLDFSNVHTILHLAAVVHRTKKISASVYFDVNTGLTVRLARAAKAAGVKHFVFFSTVKVFGSDGWLFDSERKLSVCSNCSPSDPYGASKLAAENFLMELADSNFEVCVMRPPLVYGEGAKGNLKSLNRLIRFLPVLPFAYKGNSRSVVSIDNLLMQTAFVIRTNYSGIIIPQDSKTVSLLEIVESLAKKQGRRVLMLRPSNAFISLLGFFAPALCLRLFGSLAFRLGEDVRTGEYYFSKNC